jgi:asparagine synthetase B (glutamine-hydrolysing)
VEDTFQHLALDYSEWDLLLSGGCDSRAILLMLKNRQKLRCITWGLKSSLTDPTNDAYIARQVADHFCVEHKYLETGLSSEGLEKVLTRYLAVGEGRVDHLAAYMDGMAVWKRLHEEGKGVLRGDEAFGKYAVDNPFETRDVVALRFLADCVNLRHIGPELPRQTLPDYLQRKPGETLETWWDRLNQQYELPTVWAALNDIKCAYVELANPLISRRIIEQVRMLPGPLRTDKNLFMELVRDLGPKIPFADRQAIELPKNILCSPDVVKLMVETLESAAAKRLLPNRLLGWMVANVRVLGENGCGRPPRKSGAPLKRLVPVRLRRAIKTICQRPRMDANNLAFRAYIICKMHEMLCEDARFLKGCPLVTE